MAIKWLFANGGSAIWARQCPEVHKRTAPIGVLLSVVADRDEHNGLPRKINRGEFIYLVKSGEGHSTYASFDHYKLYTGDPGECKEEIQAIASTPAFRQVSELLATRGFHALSYGGGALDIRTCWWLSRHVARLRHPIMIPISIVLVALMGLTPCDTADLVI